MTHPGEICKKTQTKIAVFCNIIRIFKIQITEKAELKWFKFVLNIIKKTGKKSVVKIMKELSLLSLFFRKKSREIA